MAFRPDREFGDILLRRGRKGGVRVLGWTAVAAMLPVALAPALTSIPGAPIYAMLAAIVIVPIGMLFLLRLWFVRTLFYERGLVHRTLFTSRRLPYDELASVSYRMDTWLSGRRGSTAYVLNITLTPRAPHAGVLRLRLGLLNSLPHFDRLLFSPTTRFSDDDSDPLWGVLATICRSAGDGVGDADAATPSRS